MFASYLLLNDKQTINRKTAYYLARRACCGLYVLLLLISLFHILLGF